MAQTDAPSSVSGVVFDHVAVAVEQWADAWPRYAVELGGKWSSGGENVGFAPAQLRYANGGGVEILEPWLPENNPFLRRFLDQNGPGPHHMTFKVKDIESAIEGVRARGFNPVGIDTTNDYWKEAFLHPRQATGVVVQLAQSSEEWTSPAPDGFPFDLRTPAATFVRVTHAVADLDVGFGLFHDFLGAILEREGASADGTWRFVDLKWNGPMRLRLISPTARDADGPLSRWLDGRTGRVHHLAFTFDSAPGHEDQGKLDHPLVPGVLISEGVEVIEPAANLGTRLVILHGADGAQS